MEEKVIYLSPSTQEKNEGVNEYGTEELRMNELADKLQELLENNNFTVYRNNPNDSLQQVVSESNAINPNLHIALHSNAGGGEARGPEIFTNRPNTPGDLLAKLIYEEILNIYPDKELGRGIKYTDRLYEIINTTSPSILIEVAFHDNIDDAKWIMDNTEQIALAIFNGIQEFFNQ